MIGLWRRKKTLLHSPKSDGELIVPLFHWTLKNVNQKIIRLWRRKKTRLHSPKSDGVLIVPLSDSHWTLNKNGNQKVISYWGGSKEVFNLQGPITNWLFLRIRSPFTPFPGSMIDRDAVFVASLSLARTPYPRCTRYCLKSLWSPWERWRSNSKCIHRF